MRAIAFKSTYVDLALAPNKTSEWGQEAKKTHCCYRSGIQTKNIFICALVAGETVDVRVLTVAFVAGETLVLWDTRFGP